MSGLFMILAKDAPDTAELRTRHHAEHLAHFKAHAERIALAGPLAGEQPGSLVILRCESVEQADAFIRADPFHGAGVWSRIEIEPFKASIINF